jgi:hypothetical protein
LVLKELNNSEKKKGMFDPNEKTRKLIGIKETQKNMTRDVNLFNDEKKIVIYFSEALSRSSFLGYHP